MKSCAFGLFRKNSRSVRFSFFNGQTKRNAIKRNAEQRRFPDQIRRCLTPLLNEERRRAILDLLNHQGRVLVTELSRQFETSQVTIRKDLEILHAHGLVHRTDAPRQSVVLR